MEKILNTIGVNAKILQSEPLHTRERTMNILGVSHTTLKKYEDEKLLESSRFRRKKYYTTETILNCIKNQFNIPTKSPWDDLWE
jgi:DNA-binding transcriptional MerR regulator